MGNKETLSTSHTAITARLQVALHVNTPSCLLKYAQAAPFVQEVARRTYLVLIVTIKIHFHSAGCIFYCFLTYGKSCNRLLTYTFFSHTGAH